APPLGQSDLALHGDVLVRMHDLRHPNRDLVSRRCSRGPSGRLAQGSAAARPRAALVVVHPARRTRRPLSLLTSRGDRRTDAPTSLRPLLAPRAHRLLESRAVDNADCRRVLVPRALGPALGRIAMSSRTCERCTLGALRFHARPRQSLLYSTPPAEADVRSTLYCPALVDSHGCPVPSSRLKVRHITARHALTIQEERDLQTPLAPWSHNRRG